MTHTDRGPPFGGAECRRDGQDSVLPVAPCPLADLARLSPEETAVPLPSLLRPLMAMSPNG
jgi:hypothetical protein